MLKLRYLILLACLPYLPVGTAVGRVQTQFKYVAVYHSAWGDSRGIDTDWFTNNGSFMTHIIHFKIDPTTTPGVWGYGGGERNHTKNRAQILSNAHAYGMKVIICIGGDNGQQFLRAAGGDPNNPSNVTPDSARLESIVIPICNWARATGYDGIDLDYEADNPAWAWVMWARFLRRQLDLWRRRGELSTAAGRTPGHPMWAYNAYMDHINIMLYDGNSWWSCAYGDPNHSGIAGFHEPLNDPSVRYPTICDGATINTVYCLSVWEAEGVNKAKAAPSTAFYGWGWAPTVTAPGQRLQGPDCTTRNCAGFTNGYDILNGIASGALTRHYDNVAQQPWVNTATQYANYQDAQSIAARLDYFKTHGWGGVFFFANEHGVDPNKPAGSAEKFVFYDAVKSALSPSTPGAPSFTTQPTSQTVLVGQAATFVVGATGIKPLVYQWQKNGVNIVGGGSATYTTPVATLPEVGTYRCTVSNSLGTATSAPATLTFVATPSPPSPSTLSDSVRNLGERVTKRFLLRIIVGVIILALVAIVVKKYVLRQ